MLTPRMTHGWLRRTVFVSCWVRAVQAVLGSEFNVTVDDADPSLHYYPPDAWYTSGDPIHEPIPVDILEGHLSSYHIPRSRLQRSSKGKKTKAPQRRTASSKIALQIFDGGASKAIDLVETVKASAPRADARTLREPLHLRSVSKFTGVGVESVLQSDDQEANASVQFEFIGSAVYIYGLTRPIAGQTDPSHNVSFSIDGMPYAGSPVSPTTPGPNGMIFGQHGLRNGAHLLEITIGDNADFAFDYLKYTQHRRSPKLLVARQEPSATLDPSTSIATASASPSPSAQANKQRNITTFAGAVGGSVGVLALLSLGLAISIIRRRRLAAKRERLEREDPEQRLRQQQQRGMVQTGSNDVVFIPRYFPGTEIPPSSPLPPGDLPPPYTPPVAPPTVANHHNVSTRGTGRNTLPTVQNPAITYALPPFHPPMRSPYLHHPPPPPSDSPEPSYADIPPDSPPPLPRSELMPSGDFLPSLPPVFHPPPPQRPTHVNVAVGNDLDQDEDVPLPPGIVNSTPLTPIHRGQSSGDRLQPHPQQQHDGSSLEHARNRHAHDTVPNDDEDEPSTLRHVASSGAGAGTVPSLAESAPLLASPTTLERTTSSERSQRQPTSESVKHTTDR